MGYYPYIQECVNGHKWEAVFWSVGDMYDTGRTECLECGGSVKKKEVDNPPPPSKDKVE